MRGRNSLSAGTGKINVFQLRNSNSVHFSFNIRFALQVRLAVIRFSRKNRFFFLKRRVIKNEIIVLSFEMSEFRKIIRACWSLEKTLVTA